MITLHSASRIFFTFLASTVLSLYATAQPTEVRFCYINNPDAPGGANQVGEDSLGFLWFANDDGLSRYDGYDFITYSNKLTDSTSLSNNIINQFHCLPDNNIWVATKNGLNYFNRSTEKFTRYHNDPKNTNSLSDDYVLCVFVDKEGTVWCGTKTGGLNRFDPLSKKWTAYRADENNPDAISSDEINDITEDAYGNLWIATDGGGIEILDRKSGKFTHMANEENNLKTISGNYINDFDLDSDGNLWLAVSGAGLNKINTKTKEVTRWLHNPDDNNSICSNEAICVTHDSRGKIWVGFWSKGVNIFDPATGVFKRMRNNPDLSTTINNDIVTTLFEDSRGIMYLATDVINYYDPMYNRFSLYQHNPSDPNSVARNDIKSTYEEGGDRLWIGTYNGGLSIYTRSTNSYRHYEHDESKPDGLPNNGIWDIMRDSKNRFWLCTSRGLCLFDTATGNCKVYIGTKESTNGMTANNILMAKEDRDGKLWLGTWYGGVNVFDPETERAVAYMHDDEDSNSISNNNVKDILIDSRNRVWIGTNYGLNFFDQSTKEFSVYLHNENDTTSISENTVNVVFEDSKGNLWVGTGAGLCLMNPDNGTFRRFSEENGMGNSIVVGVLEDDEGFLWICHQRGVDKFDPVKHTFINYNEDNGAQSGYNIWACDKGKSSKFYLGGAAGLTEFNPKEITPNPEKPNLVFTDFYLFNKRVFVNDSTPLKQSIELTKEIELTYEDYVFAFRFAALNFRPSDKVQYAYKLEGFNDEWIYTDGNNRLATFTNVPHGEYTLRVIGTNEDGVWNEEGISMRVIVHPPWWLTWWAKSMWGILIVGSAFSFYKIRVRTLESQKKKLEKQVELRTAQVVQQKEEISREKEKSDNLLLNILPKETAEELKEKGSSLPRHYKQVTILFSDFKGFSTISSQMSPDELVSDLEEYFTAFDSIIERHNIEKIKTIGDAYMCAGGIPVANTTNAVDTVSAALEMCDYVQKRNKERAAEGKATWDIRVGVHTGPLVAGVIGKKKFAYDVWGDSVNIASRLESQSESGKVNISSETYELVKEKFKCTYRGEIEIKNRGIIPMYFVEKG